MYLRIIFLFLLVFATSCKDDAPDDITTDPADPKEKLIPAGSRKVTITVDPRYDLSNTIVYGFKDSVSMTATDKALAVPNGSRDYAIFWDKITEDIVAVVSIDSLSNEVVVNAQTVTAAMHDLIPNYLSLSESSRKDFDATALKLPEYNRLVIIVDELLTNKQSIYSTDEKFIEQLLLLNSHITEKYFEKLADEGGRIASDKDIKLWLVKNTSPGVTNQVYSHVDATFTPSLIDVGPDPMTYAVKPRPLTTKPELNRPTSIPLKDGYYEVELSQKTPQAQSNNEKAFIEGTVKVFFGALGLAKLTGSELQKCQGALTLSIVKDLSMNIVSPPTDWKSGALAVVKIGVNSFEKFIKTESCSKVFINPDILLHTVIGHSNVYSAAIKKANLAIEIAELGPWIVGRWIDPIEYNTQMQVHYGEVIPGTIGFTMSEEGKLLESYEAGKKITPGVQAKILSKYDDIVFDDYQFDVDWVVESGHGTITLRTGLDHLGRSAATWTLPQTEGQYKATARVTNLISKLMGSPIIFETIIKPCNLAETPTLLFSTDGSWKASHEFKAGWSNSDYNDTSWGPAGFPPYDCVIDACKDLPCIWGPKPENTVYFRKTFTVDLGTSLYCAYRLVLASDDNHSLTINGKTVYTSDGDDRLAGPEVTTDITSFIIDGKNVIGVQAIDAYGGCAVLHGKLFGFK